MAVLASAASCKGCEACAEPAPVIEPEPPRDEPRYPPTFPVLDDAELDRRTRELEEKTPNWSIIVDAFGFVMSAECRTSAWRDRSRYGARPQEEEDEIESFLFIQSHALGLDLPGVRRDPGAAIEFTQVTAFGRGAQVIVPSVEGGPSHLSVDGHMWPGLAEAAKRLPDAQLETSLRAIRAAPALKVVHEYVPTVHSEDGPLVLHEAACLVLQNAGDSCLDCPCIDARTGEELTDPRPSADFTISRSGKVITRLPFFRAKHAHGRDEDGGQ
jgi:hypothetical protein